MTQLETRSGATLRLPTDVGGERIRVVQSVRSRWLPRTQTWLYRQVRALPASIENHVVAEVTENLDAFPVEHLHAVERESLLRRTADRAIRASRLRRYPALLGRTLESVGADLLHAHFGPWGWAVRGAARRAGVPLVVTFYGFDVNQAPLAQPSLRGRYRALFQDAAAVLCEGPHMRSCVVALGCPEEKAHVHRLGVDLDGIDFVPREPSRGRPLRVLMASAFREKKGIPVGIEALGRLARDVDLELTLIGDASPLAASQDEKRRVEAALKASGLGGRTRLLGFQPHEVLFEEAARHDLYLAPSLEARDGDTEGGAPVSLIEMVASGIPVVSTRHCDIPGVVLDGETGFLADEGDPASLERALRKTLAASARAGDMVRRGRAHVEANFDAQTQGEQLARLYARLALRPSKPGGPATGRT